MFAFRFKFFFCLSHRLSFHILCCGWQQIFVTQKKTCMKLWIWINEQQLTYTGCCTRNFKLSRSCSSLGPGAKACTLVEPHPKTSRRRTGKTQTFSWSFLGGIFVLFCVFFENWSNFRTAPIFLYCFMNTIQREMSWFLNSLFKLNWTHKFWWISLTTSSLKPHRHRTQPTIYTT